MDVSELVTLITASGALGTAAFGIVDVLKGHWKALGTAGFGEITKHLGELTDTLAVAFGPKYRELLEAQYQGNSEDFARTLRQGVRVGLTSANAEKMASFLGVLDLKALREAAEKVERAEIDLARLAETEPGDAAEAAAIKELEQAQRILGRYEMAADTRIDAAITMALTKYRTRAKLWASAVAIVLGALSGWALGRENENDILLGLALGVAAVPLAPVAKDIATAIQSTAAAMKGKG
ncbi:MAG: hypothetical protein IT365_16370 [Candidatus Hydrogenedentes bacterium]|nr:hypothetical protein [Candidatus Hydrogenedentota bacterium]